MRSVPFYDKKNHERRINMEYSNEIIAGKGVELSEALSVGGTTTLVGLGIVFGVLVILMLVLMLFKVIFYKPEAKTTEVKNEVIDNASKAVSVNESPNDETTAVMVAAIAAATETPMDKIRIKSIRKI